jgi:hyperosmotically inducible periplasmic protein
MKSRVFASAFLLASLGFAQQQGLPPPTAPPYGTPPTFPQGRQSPRQQMPPDQEPQTSQGLSSAQVQQQIQQSLNSEPALANTNVGVKTDESAVVLTGTVDSEKQHDLAVRIAQSFAGGRQVVDKIKIRQQT